MITYIEFKNKWLGKGIDYDGAYGFQCMDVYRQYVKEVLGCPQSPPVQGAKNVWGTYLPEYFDRITNSPTGVPEQGDIVIWGMAPYGHIAICDSATTATVTCFEQNWTELNGSGVTEIRKHSNYNNVLGWLKFKKQETNMITAEQKRILDFLSGKTEGQVREAFGALNDIPGLRQTIENQTKQIESLKTEHQELIERVEQLEADAKANNALILDYQSTITTAKETETNLKADVQTWKNRYEQALKDQVNKYTGWQLIRMGVNLLIKSKK